MSDPFKNMQVTEKNMLYTGTPKFAATNSTAATVTPENLDSSNYNTSTPAAAANTSPNTDVAEFSTKNSKKQKMGPIKSLKKCVSNIKKGFISFGEYTKATFKSVGNAAVAGSLIYTGGTVLNKVNLYKAQNSAIKEKIAEIAKEKGTEIASVKLPKEVKQEVITKAKEGFKQLKVHKPLAVVGAALAIFGTFWKASLSASKKRSEIEHSYEGHNKN